MGCNDSKEVGRPKQMSHAEQVRWNDKNRSSDKAHRQERKAGKLEPGRAVKPGTAQMGMGLGMNQNQPIAYAVHDPNQQIPMMQQQVQMPQNAYGQPVLGVPIDNNPQMMAQPAQYDQFQQPSYPQNKYNQ